jgi:DNA-binding protein H-NS
MKATAATKTRARKVQAKSTPSKKSIRKKGADRTYLELKQEIANTEKLRTEELATLHAQAEAARVRETADVIDKINVAIAEYGLRPQDLNFKNVSSRPGKKVGRTAGKKAAGKKTAGTKPAAKKSAAKKPSVVKFQDGEGNQWSGRGPQPKWIKAALAAGKQLDEFRAVSPSSV